MSAQLTDADKAAINAVIDAWHFAGADDAPISDVGYVYLAGKLAGARAMREAAGKVCEGMTSLWYAEIALAKAETERAYWEGNVGVGVILTGAICALPLPGDEP